MEKKSQSAAIRTVCPLSDYFGCGLLATVTDGVIAKVEPADFPNRADRGACARGLATPELVYHPERLRYPLKRTGKRGEGKWQRVSWNEALDDITLKFQEISEQYGSNSIAWGVNESPDLRGGGYCRLVSLTKGTIVDWWGFGDAAAPCADTATFGRFMEDACLGKIEDPEFSIIWGYNPAVTSIHKMREIMETRKKGCHLVVIDPRFTTTASRAHEYIPIRPGTDGALALGMIHVVMEQGLQDEQFVAENTVGPLLVRSDSGMFLREGNQIEGSQGTFIVFDQNTKQPQPYDTPGIRPALTGKYTISGTECLPVYQLLADMVMEYTPQKVSEITDVPVEVIRHLAISYATQKPASIHRGWGLQRSFYSDLTCRAINTLAAITGNINLKRPPAFMLNTRSFLIPGDPYNHVPVMMLYDAITTSQPLPVKAMLFAVHNFVNQMPNANRIISELFPCLELIVVCDLFMNATAKYADYVLPVASSYECTDLHVTKARNTYLQLRPKVIEPLYECKSDFQIAAEMGRRMGFDKYFEKTEEKYIEELLDSSHPTMDGISLERLKEGPVMAKPSDGFLKFKTPTGRIEFYTERLRQFGQELPVYLEPVESARSEKAKSYPLSLLSTHSKYQLHSSLAISPSLLKLDPEPALEINPVDAGPRSIGNGDVVCVFNDRGRVKLKAKFSQRIKPGVVNITQGWWPEQYIEGHHNQLTHERINPVQQFIREPNAALYDVLVEVKRVQ